MKVILLIGKAGVGKDESYKCIRNLYPTAERYAFADRLKVFAYEMGWDGRKDERGRKLLQGIGNTVREYKEGFWALNVVNIIKQEMPNIAVITDCRFPNEIQIMKDHFRDVTTIKIVRDVDEMDDISEHALDDYKPNYTVSNDGTIADLQNSLKDVLERRFNEIDS
jgi:dephospho-CoA kinase